ncbi:hypothetical protein ACJX0J_016305, partial [Zea mays]
LKPSPNWKPQQMVKNENKIFSPFSEKNTKPKWILLIGLYIDFGEGRFWRSFFLSLSHMIMLLKNILLSFVGLIQSYLCLSTSTSIA